MINLRAEFFSPEVKGKLAADERRALAKKVAREAEDSARSSGAHAQGNADFMRGAGSEQQQIRRAQDAVLDKMSGGLESLNEMARTIESELNDQGKMVDDIDQKTDEAQGKMDGAIKGIEKLLKTKNNCQLITIAVLVLIFVIGACGLRAAHLSSLPLPAASHTSHRTAPFPGCSHRHRAHIAPGKGGGNGDEWKKYLLSYASGSHSASSFFAAPRTASRSPLHVASASMQPVNTPSSALRCAA